MLSLLKVRIFSIYFWFNKVYQNIGIAQIFELYILDIIVVAYFILQMAFFTGIGYLY